MTTKKTLTMISGWLILLTIWYLICELGLINKHILPGPGAVINTLGEMGEKDDLFNNILFSLKISFAGYFESVLLALPVGFLLGLFPTTRTMFSQPVDALRFIPITAVGGIFIAISGLTIWTKINFLSFGIWVYLVPVIVQRVGEVSKTHLQMMQTLGASKWQTFTNVQWKYVMSRLSDDIRILVGIGWTYIVVAEMKNLQGGLGSLIWLGERQSNISKVYAAIIIIIVIGILQDKLFKYIDKLLFPHKYV